MRPRPYSKARIVPDVHTAHAEPDLHAVSTKRAHALPTTRPLSSNALSTPRTRRSHCTRCGECCVRCTRKCTMQTQTTPRTLYTLHQKARAAYAAPNTHTLRPPQAAGLRVLLPIAQTPQDKRRPCENCTRCARLPKFIRIVPTTCCNRPGIRSLCTTCYAARSLLAAHVGPTASGSRTFPVAPAAQYAPNPQTPSCTQYAWRTHSTVHTLCLVRTLYLPPRTGGCRTYNGCTHNVRDPKTAPTASAQRAARVASAV